MKKLGISLSPSGLRDFFLQKPRQEEDMVKRLRAVRQGVVSGSPLDLPPLESGCGSVDKARQYWGGCRHYPNAGPSGQKIADQVKAEF
jgi:hypothetical protein